LSNAWSRAGFGGGARRAGSGDGRFARLEEAAHEDRTRDSNPCATGSASCKLKEQAAPQLRQLAAQLLEVQADEQSWP
jgi:hypothetical protein